MGDIEKNLGVGLETIKADRTIEIPLRDALYLHKVLGEFVAFFHQPDNWRTIEDVQQFIGNKDEGALHVLWEAYYQRTANVWPADIEKAFNDGALG